MAENPGAIAQLAVLIKYFKHKNLQPQYHE